MLADDLAVSITLPVSDDTSESFTDASTVFFTLFVATDAPSPDAPPPATLPARDCMVFSVWVVSPSSAVPSLSSLLPSKLETSASPEPACSMDIGIVSLFSMRASRTMLFSAVTSDPFSISADVFAVTLLTATEPCIPVPPALIPAAMLNMKELVMAFRFIDPLVEVTLELSM